MIFYDHFVEAIYGGWNMALGLTTNTSKLSSLLYLSNAYSTVAFNNPGLNSITFWSLYYPVMLPFIFLFSLKDISSLSNPIFLSLPNKYTNGYSLNFSFILFTKVWTDEFLLYSILCLAYLYMGNSFGILAWSV